jgi:hypothetical protein
MRSLALAGFAAAWLVNTEDGKSLAVELPMPGSLSEAGCRRGVALEPVLRPEWRANEET